MPADVISSGVRGHVTLWQIDETTGHKRQLAAQPNQIQVSWGHIAAKQLGFRRQPDRDDYVISGMYFEYENQADPTQYVAVPAFPRTLGLEYYNALATHNSRDYLRVPLRLEPTLGLSPTSIGYNVLNVNNLSNQLTFFAQTSGIAGVNGKPFSHNTNSKVFAAALVAMPKFSDRARDVIFARILFDLANQTSKEASAQIGITWDIAFE